MIDMKAQLEIPKIKFKPFEEELNAQRKEIEPPGAEFNDIRRPESMENSSAFKKRKLSKNRLR